MHGKPRPQPWDGMLQVDLVYRFASARWVTEWDTKSRLRWNDGNCGNDRSTDITMSKLVLASTHI